MNFTLSDLQTFLLSAQAQHAFGNAKVTKDPSGGAWVIKHLEGDWSFKDVFYGGQPYGGQETIAFKAKVIWTMVYYGRVHDTKLGADDVYDFLRKALQFPTQASPYRGPDTYSEGSLTYYNDATGSIDDFRGKEKITEGSTEIYSATYLGGLVDQNSGIGY